MRRAPAGLRGLNAVAGLRGLNAVAGLRGLNADAGAGAVVGVLVLLLLAACGGDDAPDTGASQPPPTVLAAACPNADGSSPRTTSFTAPPPMCITAGRTYTAEVRTGKGNFTIALDSAKAPATVNNFVVLARHHYFDGVTFHRIIPGFVVQGGDPLGTGTGGPGYRFEDELPPAGAYKVGSVAMANSGPDTNGSQFFVVTGDRGATLPPQYSLFGTVTNGLDAVKAIEAVGTASGKPSEVVTMTSVTIIES